MATKKSEVSSSIGIHPVAGTLGADITGVDLSQTLDDATVAEINQALLDNLVIFFRNQHITPAQQIAFARRFGELHIHPYIPHLEGYPEVLALVSKEDGPGDMAYQSNTWHTDLTYQAVPPKACVLRGVEVPAAGGDTMWNNLYAAYEALSAPMKKFLDGMTAIHYIAVSMPADFLEQNYSAKQVARFHEVTPPVEHPVVRTHPETDRKCLFVNRNFTSHIKGLHRSESDALLAFLIQHTEQPEFVVRFHWAKDSIAMWDNRCTQHYAVVDYDRQRTMHRVTICGDRPR
jgi:taurine dioxygenase